MGNHWNWLIFFISLILLFAACQSTSTEDGSVREVEVTRIEVLEVPVVSTQIVEVTRLVPFEQSVEVEVTRMINQEVTIEPSLPGTPGNPFHLLFLPGSQEPLVEVRGGFLIEALTAETGYSFDIIIPESREEAIQFMCDNPQTTIGFLATEDVIEAQDRCNVQVQLTASRFDVPYSLGMLVTRTDLVINVIEDLAFKRVGVPSVTDLRTYQSFVYEIETLQLIGVEFVQYDTSSSVLIALLNGEIDVAAAEYNPPIMPRFERVWEYGADQPEIWRQLGLPPERDPIGYIDVAGGPEFGGYRIRDARASIFDDFPEIFERTRIVSLSDPIPNEAVALGFAFPLKASGEIVQAMDRFGNSESCSLSLCASDFYQWTGLDVQSNSYYDLLRNYNVAESE